MTNTKALREAIERSGYRIYFIADKLGISSESLRQKTNNRSEFKASEIKQLRELLKLTNAESERIFFA